MKFSYVEFTIPMPKPGQPGASSKVNTLDAKEVDELTFDAETGWVKAKVGDVVELYPSDVVKRVRVQKGNSDANHTPTQKRGK